MQFVLGIDGGGTKCDAVLMDDSGNIHGWGRGGSTHGLYVGNEAVMESIHSAVTGAMDGREVTIARIVGSGFYPGMQEWLGQSLATEQFVPGGEPALGFAMALATHGVLVLSGTGSFVHGRAADGRHFHMGGDGPIIADEGSAFHIGTLGIRAAFRSRLTEARRTSLAEAVPRALGAENLHAVFHQLYIDRLGRSQIASVARTVNAEAEAGDRVAISVLQRAADELSELVVDVIHGLGFEDSDEALVATGSVAQGSTIFWHRLTEVALEVAPRLRPVQPVIRPVIGACLLGLHDLGVEWNPALVRHIEGSQRSWLDELGIPQYPGGAQPSQ